MSSRPAGEAGALPVTFDVVLEGSHANTASVHVERKDAG
jgi:hypothetical protein